MKILFLSHWFPYPPDNGSKIRIFNLLRALSKYHEITLASFVNPDEATEAADLQTLQTYCRRVELVPKPHYQPNSTRALLGFFSARPRSVVDTFSPQMHQLVEQMGRTISIDMIIASQTGMAPYALACPNVPKILEEVELTVYFEQFARQRHPLRKLRSGLMWWKMSHYVAQLLNAFDGCTVVSELEQKRVSRVLWADQPIGVVPNGVDVAHYAECDHYTPDPDTLIYSGALTYNANFDAVEFFVRDILPLIQAKRPHVKLYITGKLDGVPVDRLPANDGVVFTGYLDDIRPAVARSWVSVVPLRIGGGTRLKILEALAAGTPVVTTSKGVEGIDLRPGDDFLVADEPADFAAAVLRLLEDKGLRQRLSQNGRQGVEAKYDWHIVGKHLNDFIEQVVHSRRTALSH